MSQNEVQEEVEPIALAEEHIAEHQTESLLVEEPEPVVVDESSALPWKPLTVVFLMWVCDLFAFTTLVYLPFMVQDFNITENPNDVGYYVGIIGSLYFVGQFISCFIWGWVSDKYGRRPVLLLGMLGSIITSIMFGFATNIYLAFSARLLFGLLNGNLGIFKTYIGEVSNKKNQSRAFSVLGLASGFGNIVGPIIGGFLARPVYHYGSVFDKLDASGITFARTILTRYPYLLPNAFVSLMAVCGFLLGIFFLKETNKKVLLARLDSTPVEIAEETPHIPLIEKIKSSPILRSRVPLLTVFMYAIYGLASIMWFEIVPLWMILPIQDGGLSFSEREPGILSAICGVFVLFFQLFVCARVLDKLGALNTWRLACVYAMPFFAIYPLLAKTMDVSMVLLWACLISILLVRHSAANLQITAVSVLINNSVPSDQKGRLNGLSQSMVALFRIAAPAAGGSLFAWSTHNTIFPFNLYFVFIIISIAYAIEALMTIGIPKSINEPMPDD